MLPIIHQLLESPRDLVISGNHVEPQAIVISPTRELAIQISDEAKKFAYRSILKIVVAYGGTSVSYQLSHVMVSYICMKYSSMLMWFFFCRKDVIFW